PGHSRPSPVTRPSIPQPPPPRPRSVSPADGSPALAPDEFEELMPIEPITAAAPVAQQPVRPVAEPLPAPKPLPEVPMLEGQNRPVAAPMSGVDSRLSGPLDMSMFESALKT